MRKIIGIAAILLSFSTTGICGSIDCSKSVLVVEKSICKNADLLSLDNDVGEKYSKLRRTLDKDSGTLLKAGQKFWLRERNDCQNVRRKDEPYFTAVYKCLSERMSSRNSYLDTLLRDNTLLNKNHSLYRFIDPWYFERYKEEYIGKRVSIFGFVQLLHFKNPKIDRRIGQIIGNDPNKTKVKIVFKSMPDTNYYFLKEKNPISYWDGTVQIVNDEVILYAEDILGQKLP